MKNIPPFPHPKDFTMNILFTILLILSDLVEFSYDMGVAARKYIVPALVATYVVGEMAWERLTSLEMDISIPAPVRTNALGFG